MTVRTTVEDHTTTGLPAARSVHVGNRSNTRSAPGGSPGAAATMQGRCIAPQDLLTIAAHDIRNYLTPMRGRTATCCSRSTTIPPPTRAGCWRRIANTRRCVPSSSKVFHKTKSPQDMGSHTGVSGSWSMGSGPRCDRARLPPFSSAQARQATARRRRQTAKDEVLRSPSARSRRGSHGRKQGRGRWEGNPWARSHQKRNFFQYNGFKVELVVNKSTKMGYIWRNLCARMDDK